MNLSHEEEDRSLSLSKFESMLKTNKVFFFDSEEFEDIVLHYLDSGKINLAKKALKLGLEQHPRSTGLKLVQIEILVFDDKLELAERMLNDLYAIEPTNEEIYIQKANIYSKRDQHDKAVEYLNIALQYTDDYADVYSLIGMEYLFMDNLELAKENFIKCLEEDTEDHSALYNVVYCFDFLDQNLEAIEFLNSFIDKNPYSEVAWHQLGRQYYVIKEYDQAFRAFDYATLIDDVFLGAYLEKAKTLEKLKKYKEAIDCYNTTMELDDPTSFALLRVGKCYERLGDNEKALKYYLKTVHEDPLLDKAWLAITDFYIRRANYQKALYYVNKAIGIDNENKVYWKRYATINNALRFHEEAEEGYRKAVEFGDVQLDTWLFWSDTLQFLGEYQTAVNTLMEASEYHTDQYEIEYRLAGLNLMLHDSEKGLYHLSNALRINYRHHTLLEEFYPTVFYTPLVQEALAKHSRKK
ncbi:hypothetical protein AM493_09790 [Flavobacterium akiainvivens]|uniref:Uncharacterized protein n=1 Tax=Flavobacterium akiainvivens TaxID=1202724 RepID=A0A0M8M9F4_9FLAO|nr:tetratricopeptide repeat protein [Flavobacterium akiainvivens]KOS06293.1 hypothetical protein AM493_09790 [Flavobacterium akiainvivens]SFQ17044.1 Tetratricopeptide repeat-containing protein [Flavobacterium akiainvivens]